MTPLLVYVHNETRHRSVTVTDVIISAVKRTLSGGVLITTECHFSVYAHHVRMNALHCSERLKLCNITVSRANRLSELILGIVGAV